MAPVVGRGLAPETSFVLWRLWDHGTDRERRNSVVNVRGCRSRGFPLALVSPERSAPERFNWSSPFFGYTGLDTTVTRDIKIIIIPSIIILLIDILTFISDPPEFLPTLSVRGISGKKDYEEGIARCISPA